MPPSSDQKIRLDRRQLLGLGATFAGAMVACGTPSGSSEETAGSATDGSTGQSHGFQLADFQLAEMDITALATGMTEGRFTSRSLVDSYITRIEEIDRQGPTLRSVIEISPDAREIADRLDEERKQGNLRGPLHGIPVLLKDNIATHDGTTAAGTLVLADSTPPADAFLAARLREAGAVILGKANLSEWANFRSTRSSSGWSGRGGQCRNPYSLDRSPCGSSSGSGVAVSANLATAAVGTETNGSIVCPASANGIVGLKPTVGLISRSGVIPISETQDTAGPMTRTVRDAAIMLAAMAGVDPADAATTDAEGHLYSDYTQFLTDDSLAGTRLGVGRDHFGFHSDVDRVMEEAIVSFRELGAEIVDPVSTPGSEEMGQASFTMMLYEFKAGVNAYLESLGDAAPVTTMEEVIAWNEANRETSLPYFGQELLEQAVGKGDLSEQEYIDAKATALRLARQEGLDKVMGEHKLDAIFAPTNGPAWRIDLVNGDSFGGGSSTPAAVSGYPNITVPAGFVQGLPIGVSIFGRAWSEPTLLRIAYAFEQATKHRQQPEFKPTLGFA